MDDRVVCTIRLTSEGTRQRQAVHSKVGVGPWLGFVAIRVGVLVLLIVSVVGCNTNQLVIVDSLLRGFQESRQSAGGERKLMIFGGSNHDVYLGCLSCNEYAKDSVFNKYGRFGSSYGIESIYNHYSKYGSAYSQYSACNPYATDPPVVVDERGNFYGSLTVNSYQRKAPSDEEVLRWLQEVVCK